jgi:hypothetical protein
LPRHFPSSLPFQTYLSHQLQEAFPDFPYLVSIHILPFSPTEL